MISWNTSMKFLKTYTFWVWKTGGKYTHKYCTYVWVVLNPEYIYYYDNKQNKKPHLTQFQI